MIGPSAAPQPKQWNRFFATRTTNEGVAPRVLAPTSTAVKVIGDTIHAEPMNVAKMLASATTIACGDRKPELLRR